MKVLQRTHDFAIGAEWASSRFDCIVLTGLNFAIALAFLSAGSCHPFSHAGGTESNNSMKIELVMDVKEG